MSTSYLLKNSEIIDLFEIKLNDFDGPVSFHGSKNFDKDLIFKGKTFFYIPCEISNLQYDSEGKQNRPLFTISNASRYISSLMEQYNNFLGKKILRYKILAKDLDVENFESGLKNPLGNSEFKEYIALDKFLISKQNYFNKEKIEFELSNPLDIDGLTCPSRKVYNNNCPWQYRGFGCGYGKNPSYDGPSFRYRKPPEDLITLEKIIQEFDSNSNLNLRNSLSLWCKPENIVYSGKQSTIIKLNKNEKIAYSANVGRNGIAGDPRGLWNLDDRSGRTGDISAMYRDFNKFTQDTQWTNSAGELNTSYQNIITGGFIASGENALVMENQVKLNSFKGIAPVHTRRHGSQAVQPTPFYVARASNTATAYDFNNKNITVFYVAEPTSVFLPNAQRYGLRTTTDPEDRLRDFDSSEPVYTSGGWMTKGLSFIEQNYTPTGSARDLAKSNYEYTSIGFDAHYNAFLGCYEKFVPRRDSLVVKDYLLSSSIHGSGGIYNNMNVPVIYGATIPATQGNSMSLYKDGYLLSKTTADYTLSEEAARSGGRYQPATFNALYNTDETLIKSLGFNTDTEYFRNFSHLIVYEVIIFNKILTQSQIEKVSLYLGQKFGINTKADDAYSPYNEVKSASFFQNYPKDGNLGVPMADENDKLFTSDDEGSFIYYDKYNFPKLNYRGDYNKDETYNIGDFVKIDPEIDFDFSKPYTSKNFELPSRFFVCLKDSVKGYNPLQRNDLWVEDKCSKKLSGCLVRFRKNDNSKVPFGGFPGTVSYDYKLPN